MIRPTAKVSEEVNRKCPLGTWFYSFQPYANPEPSDSPPPQFSQLFAVLGYVDWVKLIIWKSCIQAKMHQKQDFNLKLGSC